MTITQPCLTCKQNFEITDADQNFYRKLNAPHPQYCPTCRVQRRYQWRNERSLYKRHCDSCKKSIIALYPASAPWPVYCHGCWWSDNWDPKSYSLNYDPAKPFLDQYRDLITKVPRIGLLVINSVNSDYCNNSADLKNCYLIFAAEKCEDCLYGRLVQNCKSVVDVAFAYNSERCYECVDCHSCYQCLYSQRCQDSTDILFSYDVRASDHCILSTNVRHGSYLIENKKCTKEEFEAKKKEILSSRENIELARKRLEELKNQTITKFAYQTKCADATGDYLYNCHQSKHLFDTRNAKECAYLSDAEDPLEVYDGNNIYYHPQFCLDIMGVLQINNCKHCSFVFDSANLEYCDNCHNVESSLGCVGLRKSQYCILNKQYTKEEYDQLKAKIVEQMKNDGSYGQFAPPSIAPFAYNESLAKDFYPLSKEEALARGFRWQEANEFTKGKETMKTPNTIGGVNDDIIKQILACVACGRNYIIAPQELAFYRMMGVPLPNMDFECRHMARMQSRTPRKLWSRGCQCSGASSERGIYRNSAPHFHSTDHCPNEFQTAYALERPEIVYCESCYQQEVV